MLCLSFVEFCEVPRPSLKAGVLTVTANLPVKFPTKHSTKYGQRPTNGHATLYFWISTKRDAKRNPCDRPDASPCKPVWIEDALGKWWCSVINAKVIYKISNFIHLFHHRFFPLAPPLPAEEPPLPPIFFLPPVLNPPFLPPCSWELTLIN